MHLPWEIKRQIRTLIQIGADAKLGQAKKNCKWPARLDKSKTIEGTFFSELDSLYIENEYIN